MKEEEKIFAGKLFDARTKELRDIKHKAHTLCQRFNLMDEYDEKRLPIIKEFIGKIGEKYYFQGPIHFNYGCHTFIGEILVPTSILQFWMTVKFSLVTMLCLDQMFPLWQPLTLLSLKKELQ